jgi:hypothetical protein
MMSLVGGAAGLLFYLYSVVFRGKAVVSKYGRLDLYFWLVAVTTACSLLGYLVDLAIWGVQYANLGKLD